MREDPAQRLVQRDPLRREPRPDRRCYLEGFFQLDHTILLQ